LLYKTSNLKLQSQRC